MKSAIQSSRKRISNAKYLGSRAQILQITGKSPEQMVPGGVLALVVLVSGKGKDEKMIVPLCVARAGDFAVGEVGELLLRREKVEPDGRIAHGLVLKKLIIAQKS